jgi:tRNA pseudouridine55 synthase
MNGVLVIDKPAGPTSHDVVARVRKALGTRRIGHTGTLDPLATGVLPLVIGTATRLASLLSGGEKEYVAGIRLGLATETYDAIGRDAVPAPPPGITAADVEGVLENFRGSFEQVPPPYSAKKIDGIRAYKLARKRTPVQPPAVRVIVHHLTIENCSDGLIVLRVRASAGFYVRSLAHDLGQKLGCGAHLETLRRVRAATFVEEDSVLLSVVEREREDAARRIVPLEQLLPDIPAVVLSDRDRDRVAHGADVALAPRTVEGPAPSLVEGPAPILVEGSANDPRPVVGADLTLTRRRLIDTAGQLVALAEVRHGGFLHPVIVLV